MDKFYEHVIQESKILSDILADDQDMDPLTDTQQTDCDSTTTCGACGQDFTKSNDKVRHHDHVSGQFLFAACNNCNLTLKMPNRKRKVTEGQRPNKKPKFDKDYTKNFFLPVVFHNLKSYDAHFVIKHFKKQYTARSRDQNDDDIYEQEESVSYGDIRMVPLRKVPILSSGKSAFHRLFSVSFHIPGQPRVAVVENWSR